jgi:hypothetical protein
MSAMWGTSFLAGDDALWGNQPVHAAGSGVDAATVALRSAGLGDLY